MSASEDVKLAAERAVGHQVSFLYSTPVVETLSGEIVWQGMVDVFRPYNPPPWAVYGWAVDDPAGTQYVAVLGIEPIKSPLDAVHAWIVSRAKSQ